MNSIAALFDFVSALVLLCYWRFENILNNNRKQFQLSMVDKKKGDLEH
jgi:hypothetical protein